MMKLTGMAGPAWDILHGVKTKYLDSIIGVLLIVTAGRYMDFLSRRRAADAFVGLYSLIDETSSVRLSGIEVRPAHRSKLLS